MKIISNLLLILISLNSYSQVTNIWTRKADVPGIKRCTTISFSTDSFGYIGLGEKNGLTDTNDLFQYNPATNTWAQKANFPGGNRSDAIVFAIGPKAYIGLGEHLSALYNDFWEYDYINNTWMRKTDFPGTSLLGAIGFNVGDKGYVALGSQNFSSSDSTNEVWQYSVDSNIWTRKSNFPKMGSTRGKRVHATSFIINGEAYVGLGSISGVESLNDFWKYEQSTDTWLRKADFPGSQREGAFGFSIGNKGFVGTGLRDSFSICTKDFWQYDPSSDTWTLKDTFAGEVRAYSSAFSINGKGYVGTGWNVGPVFNDFWEYTPDSLFTTSIKETDINNMMIFPIPSSNKIYLNTSTSGITVTDITGRVCTVPHTDRDIDITSLPAGVYCIRLQSKDDTAVRRFVKE